MKSGGTAAIYGREMRSYFTSPIAYVVLTVFLAIVGLCFASAVRDYVSFDTYLRERLTVAGHEARPADVQEYLIRRLVSSLAVFSLLVLPFITMGTFAEEHRAGTMELLLTSPLKLVGIVLAKFLAVSTFFAVMLVLALGLVSSLRLFGNPHLPTVWVGFIGLFLLGETFLVVGMFISSLTRSQIVAGVGGLGTVALLCLATRVGDSSSTLGRWLTDLSLVRHFDDFSKGILDTKHIVFYVSFVFFGLFLTVRSLESLKYR